VRKLFSSLAVSVVVLVSTEDMSDSGIDKASVLSSFRYEKRSDCCRPRICMQIILGGGRLEMSCARLASITVPKQKIRQSSETSEWQILGFEKH
jgi:hypothetical protein